MFGKSEREPRRQRWSPSGALTLLVVVGLVAGSVTPLFGVALAESSVTGGESDSSDLSLLPISPTGGDAKPNGTPGTGPGESPNGTDTPDEGNETDTPGDGNETTTPGPPNGTPGHGPTPGRPPGDSPSPPSDPSPPGNGTETPNETTPPADPGPPDNRTGPPENRTGPPENRTGPPENRTGPPANRTGPPNGTSPGEGTRIGRPADAPTVNVTVPNATANQSVSVNVSHPESRDGDVAFSSMNVTPTKNTTFSLNVTESEAPITGKTPGQNLSNGTKPLAYLSVDHSISDRNIRNVTFRFRVAKDKVNDSETDEIALYRHHNGTWNELPTTLVETTESHYVYRVRSPGLSEFAAGKQTAQFEITNATVELTTLSVGDALKVRVRISNDGDADGTFTAELVIDGESIASRQLTIAAGGMRQTTFERTVAEPGTYDVYVNDFWVGDVTVNGTADPTSDGPTEETDSDETGTDDQTNQNTNADVPGFGFAAGVAALLAVTVAAVAGRRRS